MWQAYVEKLVYTSHPTTFEPSSPILPPCMLTLCVAHQSAPRWCCVLDTRPSTSQPYYVGPHPMLEMLVQTLELCLRKGYMYHFYHGSLLPWTFYNELHRLKVNGVINDIFSLNRVYISSTFFEDKTRWLVLGFFTGIILSMGILNLTFTSNSTLPQSPCQWILVACLFARQSTQDPLALAFVPYYHHPFSL